jgi:hypothetical protein
MTVRKPEFRFKLDRIEISSEEILADLLYPAAKPVKKAPKRAPHRPGFRS